jgi:protein SCO1
METASNPTVEAPRQPRRKSTLPAFLLLSLLAAAIAIYWNLERAGKKASTLPTIGKVAEFTLMERSGATVTRQSMLGKIWIADFIFASCGATCPFMTERMRMLSEDLAREGLDEVIFVSVSVDPARDTPKELRLYATLYHASPTRWLFLTGDKREIEALAVKSFGLGAPEPVPGEDQILHSSKFFLVDCEGRVRGTYAALTEDEENDLMNVPRDRPMPETARKQLIADIRTVIEQGPSK